LSGLEPREKPRAKRGAPRSGKPTLRTIAEMTGLAITTISRALNNAPELSAETRERVQKIAAEIGYVPDRTALRLKTGRTHVVSLILDPHDEIINFSSSLVAGITAAFRGTPYHLVITPGFRGTSPLDPIQYVLSNKMADGVIFWVAEEQGRLLGVMGIQDKGEVALVRHAYVVPTVQRKGVGTKLLHHVTGLANKPILIGTWADAAWAIGFYRRNGFTVVSNSHKEALLRRYWSIPARQIETSVVLADGRWMEAQQ